MAADLRTPIIVHVINVALQHSREAFAMSAPRVLRRVAVNPVDVPTLLASVRPDPVAHAGQWHKTD